MLHKTTMTYHRKNNNWHSLRSNNRACLQGVFFFIFFLNAKYILQVNQHVTKF